MRSDNERGRRATRRLMSLSSLWPPSMASSRCKLPTIRGILPRPAVVSCLRKSGTNSKAGLLRAYRWQYILSGAQHPHFIKVLTSLITDAQTERVQAALASLM